MSDPMTTDPAQSRADEIREERRTRQKEAPTERVPTERWDYEAHPGDCCPRVEGDAHTVCCRECAGTGVWPVPWIDSPAQGAGREDATCVRCKASARMEVAMAAYPHGPLGVTTDE